MKKSILIITIMVMSIFTNAQLMKSPNITTEKHDFGLSFAAGFFGSAIVSTSVYAITENKYIAYASGVVASIGMGYLQNRYETSKGKEFANRNVINAAYGGAINIVVLSIVIPKKKKTKLVEF